MPTTQTKGITVKIDAALHAEIKAHLEQNEMTMSEFIALTLQDELHPKIQEVEVHNMAERTRTLAFQVPENLFQWIKEYLARNQMTQRAFVIGLIEEELLHQQEQDQEDAEEEQDDDPVGDFEDSFDSPGEEQDEGFSEDVSADFAPEDEQPEYDSEQDEVQAVGDFEDNPDGSSEEQDEDEAEEEYMGMSM